MLPSLNSDQSDQNKAQKLADWLCVLSRRRLVEMQIQDFAVKSISSAPAAGAGARPIG
jgi:hypothetical protein